MIPLMNVLQRRYGGSVGWLARGMSCGSISRDQSAYRGPSLLHSYSSLASWMTRTTVSCPCGCWIPFLLREWFAAEAIFCKAPHETFDGDLLGEKESLVNLRKACRQVHPAPVMDQIHHHRVECSPWQLTRLVVVLETRLSTSYESHLVATARR